VKPTRLAAASLLFLVVLAPALFAAAGGANGSGLSPALADAPKGLVSVAWQAGQQTGVDGNVLLAIAKVECDYGRCRTGQPDDLVPDGRPSGADQAIDPHRLAGHDGPTAAAMHWGVRQWNVANGESSPKVRRAR
jgi:hypothetical protein